MKFRNPWIDPRVLKLSRKEAETYLEEHGWEPLQPYESPTLNAFVRPGDGGKGPIVYVPKVDDEMIRIQRMIELVAALAFAEDRWAVEVLADILHIRNEPNGGNGTATPQAAESAAS